MERYPSSIVRTTKIIETKGLIGMQLVSVTFIATFIDGTQKQLNSKSWERIGLMQSWRDGEWIILGKDETPLYYQDWSNNPVFGQLGKNIKKNLKKYFFNSKLPFIFEVSKTK